ncbi:helix-turn-helix domain-containing protein [Arenimonas terrae]|uniref:AraC family transcriptional regulator n=1 Tax=Arenimonas terrae TaxID=2546226 RepID=A0A5C4RQN1_9GAMM|nr:AraC family transcriptional regulator [Arenimonas terrae]TNJ33249.1 AraC family transcriptional regulator [Arenimonas terrae]
MELGRSKLMSLAGSGSRSPDIAWAVAGRNESELDGTGGELSIWLQVRRGGHLRAREGQFALDPGEWLVLDRSPSQKILGNSLGVLIGVVLSGRWARQARELGIVPGRGRFDLAARRRIVALWRVGAAGRLPEAQAATEMLLALAPLARCHDASIARCPGRSAASRLRVFARMQRARLMLDGNRHRVVRLEELSALTNFSRWYLSRQFLEIYEESPQEASIRLRAQHACALLRTTDWPVKRIAVECGFENCASFGRMYRRTFGKRPSDERSMPSPTVRKLVGANTVASKKTNTADKRR